jgi:hypothetical protein
MSSKMGKTIMLSGLLKGKDECIYFNDYLINICVYFITIDVRN